jgi:predicted RNA-binding Zn-ribbon protein involved in translation (DUF1610 family)
MGVSYYERKTRTFTCDECSWTGLGSELGIYESYSEIVEWACPNCGEKLTFSSFPTREETQAAAEAGDQEAVGHLPVIDRGLHRWHRVLETRGSDVAAPAELDHGDVRCVLSTAHDEEDETWLTLTANGLEIHRELAVWEDIEPAHRMLALLHQRYGERLRSFNWKPALLYLAGDRLSHVSELDKLVANLPEGDGTASGNERRDG